MATRASTRGWWGSSAADIMHKFNNRAPIDLDGIAREMGVEIVREPLGDASGKIVKTMEDGKPKYTIHVNTNHSPRRQRFTIAHELAHLMLHAEAIGDGITDDALYRSALDHYDPELERAANRFAADILMPTSLFVTEWRTLRDPNLLADRFEASREAIDIRLRWLVARRRLPPEAAPPKAVREPLAQ
jgi:Zn-dependent peptidase ImmA (M78 family)